jgi:peptidoglycan hydrolase-like protein with peptidoglycan-binding domain
VDWALAHPADLEYVIHNRTIWTRARGFQPKKYTGKDPHTDHVHISGRHGSVGKDAATGTGYDAPSEGLSPTGTPSKPGQATPMIPKQAPAPAPGPNVHRPGSRELRLLSPPMSGADVSFLQRFIGPRKCGPPTGVFNDQTRKGVRWYQNMRGIDVDGRVGHDTWSNMGVKNSLKTNP